MFLRFSLGFSKFSIKEKIDIFSIAGPSGNTLILKSIKKFQAFALGSVTNGFHLQENNSGENKGAGGNVS